jgi:hypothetical protein
LICWGGSSSWRVSKRLDSRYRKATTEIRAELLPAED